MCFQNGPIHIRPDFSAVSNNVSWDHLADYVWIDQPVYAFFARVNAAVIERYCHVVEPAFRLETKTALVCLESIPSLFTLTYPKIVQDEDQMASDFVSKASDATNAVINDL